MYVCPNGMNLTAGLCVPFVIRHVHVILKLLLSIIWEKGLHVVGWGFVSKAYSVYL